ncbi:DUF4013 domain-containing protein [Haloferacaceae archaeon DSL9]
MFGEALRAVGRSDDTASTALIGGVLTLVSLAAVGLWFAIALFDPLVALSLAPLALLPEFVVRGYLVRTLEAGRAGDPTAPSFVRWGELLKTGARASLLSLLAIAPTAAFAALAVGIGNDLVRGPIADAGATEVLLGFVVTAAGLLALGFGVLALYIYPAMLVVFADSGRLRTALGVGELLTVTTDSGYATGWLVAAVVTFVTVPIAIPLTVAVVGVVPLFLARVIGAFAIGRGVSDARVGAVADDARSTRSTSRPPSPPSGEDLPAQTATVGESTPYPDDVALAEGPREATGAVQTGRDVADGDRRETRDPGAVDGAHSASILPDSAFERGVSGESEGEDRQGDRRA